MSSKQASDATHPLFLHAEVILSWIFTFAICSTSLAIWYLRSANLAVEQTEGDFANLCRLTIMGLALVWLGPLLVKLKVWQTVIARFFLLILLIFLPWLAVRTVPELPARILIDLVFGMLAVSGIVTGTLSINAKRQVLAAIFGILLGLSIFTALVGKGYIHPFTYEDALAGLQHRDTMYHAAISSMLEYHDAISVGMDGLVPVSYHVLSHRFTGSVANWLDAPVLMTSGFAFSIAIVPLMFHTFCTAALSLRPNGWVKLDILPAIIFLLCWPFLFSLLQNSAYYASESYILSLSFMFAIIPVMAKLAQTQVALPTRAFVYATMFVAILLASSAKISTGAILASGLAIFLAVNGRFKLQAVMFAVCIAASPFLTTFMNSFGSQETSGIVSPLHFLSEWREQALLHIILLICTGFIVWKFPGDESTHAYLVIPLYLMAASGVFASLLVELPAGAAIYFANPAMWLCILLLTALLPSPTWASKTGLQAQFAIALIVFTVIIMAEEDRWKAVDETIITNRESTQQAQKTTKMNVTIVGKVVDHAEANGRNFLVFVAPDFWDFWAQNKVCWAQSFVIPALTAQPLLSGLPPKKQKCAITSHYGLSSYDYAISASREMTEEQICENAQARGFSAVLKFDSETATTLFCNN